MSCFCRLKNTLSQESGPDENGKHYVAKNFPVFSGSYVCANELISETLPLRKIPKFHLIFWWENFVERHSFRHKISTPGNYVKTQILAVKVDWLLNTETILFSQTLLTKKVLENWRFCYCFTTTHSNSLLCLQFVIPRIWFLIQTNFNNKT